MAPKRPRISKSDDAPVQWEDLPRDVQSKTRAAYKDLGISASSKIDKSIAGFDKLATESDSEGQRKKARSAAGSLREYGRVLKDIPITLQRGATRRTDLMGDAVSRAKDSGASNPRGWGWYYEHREGVDMAAPSVSPEVRSAASAGMSPQADPKTGELPDLKSVHDALQDPYAVRTVKSNKSPQRDKARKAAGVVSGQELKVSEATTQQLATTDIGMGVMQNLERGIGALRGEVPPEQVNTAPKTKAYQNAIRDAAPPATGEGWTPERLDYMQIGSHVVHGDPNQGMFMFSKSSPGPLSKHSMLSAERSSPQDTWMEGIGSGQDMSMELSEGSPLRKAPSPAKRAIDKGAPLDASTLGSGDLGITVDDVGHTGVTPEDVRHAFHDKANRVASEKYGRVSFNQFGEDIFIPAVAMQETTWNEGRAGAGADADFNRERKLEVKAKAKAARPPTAKALQEEAKANPRLFSVDKPTGPKGEPPFLTPKRDGTVLDAVRNATSEAGIQQPLTTGSVEQGPPWPTAMTAGENTKAVQERRRKDENPDD